MSTKMIKTEVSLARNNHNEVHFYLKDSASRIPFATIKLSLEQLGLLVTGLTLDNIPCEVIDLENVGKVKIQERRSMVVTEGHPLYTLRGNTSELSKALKHHHDEIGWNVNAYLGSRGSILLLDDGFELNYTVYKYVDPEE